MVEYRIESRAKAVVEVPAAEAIKADGTSMVALLIPKLPKLIGNEAWIHIWSVNRMLQMETSKDRNTSSNWARVDDWKIGAVRRA